MTPNVPRNEPSLRATASTIATAFSPLCLATAIVTAGDEAPRVYGVNTGFGALSETRISAHDVRQLQRNLVRSHSTGVGPNLGDGRWRYGGADGEIFTSIYFGRPHGMPAFGGALDAEEPPCCALHGG